MSKEIRVLHVLGEMSQGGTENFLMNLYKNVDRNKVQFDFLVNRKGLFDKEIRKMGGEIYYLPALQKVGLFRYIKNLDNFFKEHSEYERIHSHLNQVTGLILERAKKANISMRIAHSHSSKGPKNIVKKVFKNYLGSKIEKNATLLIGCSDKANEWLYGKDNNSAIIICNGIEINKFKFDEEKRSRIRREIGIKENEIVIGHVGRFSEVKNHKYLLEIFREYNKQNEKSKLLLIGDGELKNEIERKIRTFKLDEKVIMLGNSSDVATLYQAMDMFIFPSMYEGLPLTLIEAQTAGLEILASKNITKMVDVTHHIQFLDINEKPEVWTKEMLKMNIDRYDESEKIIEAGYDIKEIALKYMNLIGCD